MRRTTFIILTLVIMALIGFYVRAGRDKTDQPQVVAGPDVPHDTSGAYENCLSCHGNITESHNERFGAGNYDDCLSCHNAS